jgi:KaiC/GvpD/RAD55 family RecA-like ATPase
MSTDKLIFLENISKSFGDFELFYVKGYDPDSRKAIAGWTTWKKYSECTEQEKEQANLRSVLKEEIVLDIEQSERFDPIISELMRVPCRFNAFRTGSRGYHIHMVFPELKNMESNNVQLVKENIIKHFGCDISKKSERNMIAIEYEPHFKTGNIKELVATRTDVIKNNLNLFIATTIRLKEIINIDPKFNDLYCKGEWQKWGFPSRSEAEQSLCGILANQGFKYEEIYAIMENNAVGKWQEKPDSYKKMTIEKSLEKSVVIPQIEETMSEFPFKYFEEYGIPQPVSWLVSGYIPAKGVTILTGVTGCGKSFVSEEMICAILQNRKWFNELPIINKRPIVLIDMENDHSTLYDRIQKMGGVPANMLLVFSFDHNFDMTSELMVHYLKQIVEQINPCLIIFDTLRRVYSGDENDSRVINDMYKRVLMPLSRERCVLLIAHRRKGGKNNDASEALDQIRGTGDISGLASSVIEIRKNLDETLTIIPRKLRPAKLCKEFNVKINNDNDKIKFEFMGSFSNILSEIDVVVDNIMQWCNANRTPECAIKTKEIVNEMRSLGHKERNIFSAVRILTAKGYLIKEQRGVYRYIKI